MHKRKRGISRDICFTHGLLPRETIIREESASMRQLAITGNNDRMHNKRDKYKKWNARSMPRKSCGAFKNNWSDKSESVKLPYMGGSSNAK